MQETQVQSLGQEDPRRRNGNPLHYSWLQNPMDRGAWWATVHGGYTDLDRTEQLTPPPSLISYQKWLIKLTKSEGLTTALWLAGVRAPLPPHLLLSTLSPTAHLHVRVVPELQGPCSHDSGAYWPVAVVATWPPVERSKFKNPAEQPSHIMLTSTIQAKPQWLGSSLNLTQPKMRLAPLQWGSWSVYKL